MIAATTPLFHRHLGSTEQAGAAIGGPAKRLVLLHGFTQNSQCWGPFGQDLATSFETVAVDAPGHGRSLSDDADLPTTATLVGQLGGSATYVGYSMGGRTALHLALAQPELVDALVLIGATAGIEDDAQREARQRADDELAARLLHIGLKTFLDEWLATPLFATLTPEASCAAQRMTNRPDGLAASLKNCGTGTQHSLWARLHELSMPVLLLAGEFDLKFTALAHRMAEAIGSNAGVSIGPGGHALHLEQPGSTAELVRAFVSNA